MARGKGSIDLHLLRNIGIAAHIDAGKTTTTERILFYTGRTHRIGEVDEGTATMDWMLQEQERGITITSAVTFCEWDNHFINIIDTPGHVDFTVEVERALRVLDGVIVLFCGVGGVEPQSETIWRQCDRYRIARIAYINKLDRKGASFFEVVEQMRKKLGANPVPVQIPYMVKEELCGLIDLVRQKMLVYKNETGTEYEYVDVPREERQNIEHWRHALLEKIAEVDDSLMERYVHDKPFSEDAIYHGLRKGTIENKLVPVLCGSSLKNRGVQPLLDAVTRYLPSPLDLGELKVTDPSSLETRTISRSSEAPFSMFLFKVMTDPHVGKLSFVRVYSGKIKAGSFVYNATRKIKERISRILRMHADKREEVEALEAGDLGAIVGFKLSSTGDTLCTEHSPVLLEAMTFPQPVISQAVEPATKADQDKLSQALAKLSDEDPTFQATVDPETGQTIISGMGELHLEILMDRLAREFKVQVSTGQPQVAYREAFKAPAQAEGRYVKQTGGRGQFGVVKIAVEPLGRGEGNRFVNKIRGGSIPGEYIPAVQKGIEEVESTGILAGFPIVDTQVTLLDGQYHEVDSSEMAYKIAASIALKRAADQAGLILLEPVAKVEITTPEDFVGDLISDLNARRGKIENIELFKGNTRTVKALVPIAEMFGYATDLRSLSQGRATYTMQFSHYAQVPDDKLNQILGKKKEIVRV